MAMRHLLVLALLTACSDPTGDTGPDANYGPLFCDPPATTAPPATGDGTPPIGTFSVIWECVSGCDGTVPLVIEQANGLTITSSTRESGYVDGSATWSIGGEALYPISMSVRDGCWYRAAPIGECHSDFYVCDRAGRVEVPHIAVRDYETGAEQIWKMR